MSDDPHRPRMAQDECARWIRLFNRLEAAVSHHRRATGVFPTDADEALWAARDRVLRAAAEEAVVTTDIARMRSAIEEYAEHQSWRCGHPDRYPWDPDCPCGLTRDLRALGMETS